MKSIMLLLVFSVSLSTMGFNSDYNPAPNQNIEVVQSEDCNCVDVSEAYVPAMVAERLSNSLFSIIEIVERIGYPPILKVRTLEGFTSNIDKPPSYQRRL